MEEGRFGKDAFPIRRFILQRPRTLRLSRGELVRRLGYRDLGKAHNVLRVLLALVTGENLASTKALRDAVLPAITEQQNNMRRARVLAEDCYRAVFRPHLQVQPERRIPSQIFMAAMIAVARLRVVSISDIGKNRPPLLSQSESRLMERCVIRKARRLGFRVPRPALKALRGQALECSLALRKPLPNLSSPALVIGKTQSATGGGFSIPRCQGSLWL